MRGPRSAMRRSRAYWLTLALFLALQIADIVTTNYARGSSLLAPAC